MLKQFAVAGAAALLCASASATTHIITFDDLVHGQMVDDEYVVSHGLTISGTNIGGGPDIIAGFDTTLDNTRDPDLEYGDNGWRYGNLGRYSQNLTELGRLLIIQENSTDNNNDGILDYPDDEAGRPAGSIFLNFDTEIESFGMDVVDVEGPSEWSTRWGGQQTNDAGYYAVFYSGGAEIGRIGFADWLTYAAPPGWDPVQYGNNSANRLHELPASFFGATTFDRVEINLGGSAGIDNITYFQTPPDAPPVPEPATLGLLGLGLAGMAARRRFRA